MHFSVYSYLNSMCFFTFLFLTLFFIIFLFCFVLQTLRANLSSCYLTQKHMSLPDNVTIP